MSDYVHNGRLNQQKSLTREKGGKLSELSSTLRNYSQKVKSSKSRTQHSENNRDWLISQYLRSANVAAHSKVNEAESGDVGKLSERKLSTGNQEAG